MNNKYAKITKNQIGQCILPLIPKNKRGFSCTFDLSDIVQCIIYKLKTGVQLECLFIEIESVNPPFSWQLVYYYYRKWCKSGVFKQMFEGKTNNVLIMTDGHGIPIASRIRYYIP